MTDAPTAKRPKCPVRLKRTWKPQEDEKLMDAMMELHASGKYAADNGFKPTFLNYHTHPKADVLRDKPFIYYHKLATIFGKDRASGSRAVDLGEEEVVSETEETTPTDIEGIHVDSGVNPSLENVGVKARVIRLITPSINEMNKNLSKMANEDERKIQCEIDLMKKVQNEIDALPDITFEEAYEAINVIGKCPFKAEMLFGYDQGKKIRMVQMVARKSTSNLFLKTPFLYEAMSSLLMIWSSLFEACYASTAAKISSFSYSTSYPYMNLKLMLFHEASQMLQIQVNEALLDEPARK
ncbi:hypothetical protein CTI12_AA448890 [Artemisia annua]|uniref:Uncharacterized protein n=1 Tax=Artemisia annua TaxID=35608 RepID=A0A2U1LW03_ARTAN|nr:hypothetical protein CTI12_AA448890 [Artemisia annua]